MKELFQLEIEIDEAALQYALSRYVKEQVTSLHTWSQEKELKAKIKAMMDSLIDQFIAEMVSDKADTLREYVEAEVDRRINYRVGKAVNAKAKETAQ